MVSGLTSIYAVLVPAKSIDITLRIETRLIGSRPPVLLERWRTNGESALQ